MRGELVGGVDILLDMVETAKSMGGGLKTTLGLSLSSTSAINMEEKAKQRPGEGDLDEFCEKVRLLVSFSKNISIILHLRLLLSGENVAYLQASCHAVHEGE